MKHRTTSDKLAEHNQHTLFAKPTQPIMNQMTNPDGIIKCEDLQVNVFQLMADVMTKSQHPFLSEQVADIAAIAMHSLSHRGKELLQKILGKTGASVSHAKTYTDGTLYELLQCFGAEIIYFQSLIKMLPEDQQQSYCAKAATLAEILDESLSDYKPLLHVQKEHPQVTIVKLSMLDSMYVTRYLTHLLKQIIAQQDNATTPDNTYPAGSPQEILARKNYPLAADHASDLALLLLESPDTQNKAELRQLVNTLKPHRQYESVNVTMTLNELLISTFQTEIKTCLARVDEAPTAHQQHFHDNILKINDECEAITKQNLDIISSSTLNAKNIDAKSKIINIIYQIRLLRQSLEQLLTSQTTNNHQRSAPPSRPKAIHDNGTPPSTHTSSDESHSPKRPSYSSDLDTHGLEKGRKCAIM